MDKQDIEKRLLDHVDPNRRSFVRQILGGAALAAPLIATFSIDSLIEPQEARAANACAVEEEGYAGPSTFQGHFTDPTHTTKANGSISLVISGYPPGTVKDAKVNYSIVLSPNASFVKAHIESHGDTVAHLDAQTGTITKDDVSGLCDFYEFLDALDSEYSTIVVVVEVQGNKYTLSGTIKGAAFPVITLGK